MSAPTKGQVARLVEAAWKPPVTSIDATLYLSVTRPIVPREELEKTVRDVYSTIEGKSNAPKQSVEEFEKSVAVEVERMRREQQSPAVIKKRVRWNGIQYREDKVSVEGSIKVVDTETEFNRVIVNTGNHLLKDYTNFEYDIVNEVAAINDKQGSLWKEDSVWDAFGIQPVSMLLKALTMVPLSPEDIKQGVTNFVPAISTERVLELQENKNEHLILLTCPDEYKSYRVDRFEVRTRQNSERPLLIFYCDAKDYSKLYRSESYHPTIADPLLTVERDMFDSKGFPKVWITEEYDPDTKQMRRAERVFESVSINVQLPNDIYEYNPPEGFSTIDYRPDTPIVVQPHERTYSISLPEHKNAATWRHVMAGIGILFILIALGRMWMLRINNKK